MSRPSADRPTAAHGPPSISASMSTDRRMLLGLGGGAGSASWGDSDNHHHLPPPPTRDRAAKRLANNGARWRGLLARRDLVDGKADAYCIESNEDITPRSSFDIEEANSQCSWEIDPPSTSVRGWRSNHSLSYRPRPTGRPRHIRVIGRQCCINDLTDIVDAANEPCVSYDRQIFDPVSKLWTYVEASLPSSSRWELRTVGSPITWSVSGTEEGISTIGRGASAPPTAAVFPAVETEAVAAAATATMTTTTTTTTSRVAEGVPPVNVGANLLAAVSPAHVPVLSADNGLTKVDTIEQVNLAPKGGAILHVDGAVEVTELLVPSPVLEGDSVEDVEVVVKDGAGEGETKDEDEDVEGGTKRRFSSPPVAALTNDEVARRVFMRAREQWLGYSRKSVYGPANLEAVIFASEMEDADVGARRASMV